MSKEISTHTHLRLLSFLPLSRPFSSFSLWSQTWSLLDVGFTAYTYSRRGCIGGQGVHSALPSGPCTSLNIGAGHLFPLGGTKVPQHGGDPRQRSICLEGQQMGSVSHTWERGVMCEYQTGRRLVFHPAS